MSALGRGTEFTAWGLVVDTPDGDGEFLARLEAFLRRPREIFTDEWQGYRLRYDGPGISTSWFIGAPDERVNVHLEWEDDWSRAWDSMRDNRDFSHWYFSHEPGGLRGRVVRDYGARRGMAVTLLATLVAGLASLPWPGGAGVLIGAGIAVVVIFLALSALGQAIGS